MSYKLRAVCHCVSFMPGVLFASFLLSQSDKGESQLLNSTVKRMRSQYGLCASLAAPWRKTKGNIMAQTIFGNVALCLLRYVGAWRSDLRELSWLGDLATWQNGLFLHAWDHSAGTQRLWEGLDPRRFWLPNSLRFPTSFFSSLILLDSILGEAQFGNYFSGQTIVLSSSPSVLHISNTTRPVPLSRDLKTSTYTRFYCILTVYTAPQDVVHYHTRFYSSFSSCLCQIANF